MMRRVGLIGLLSLTLGAAACGSSDEGGLFENNAGGASGSGTGGAAGIGTGGSAGIASTGGSGGGITGGAGGIGSGGTGGSTGGTGGGFAGMPGTGGTGGGFAGMPGTGGTGGTGGGFAGMPGTGGTGGGAGMPGTGGTGGGTGGTGGGTGQGQVTCGGMLTCDLSTSQCCAKVSGFACVSKNQGCGLDGASYTCDGPEDCNGGICCGTRANIPVVGTVYTQIRCQSSCDNSNETVFCNQTPSVCSGGTCAPSTIIPDYNICRN